MDYTAEWIKYDRLQQAAYVCRVTAQQRRAMDGDVAGTDEAEITQIRAELAQLTVRED